MRLSQAFIPTLKEVPADAEVKSHILMLRAGLIRLHIAGVYSYLPVGWRVMRKVIEIIREEMNRIGAQEFFLPALSRKEIWEKTGRWELGDMFKFKDRKDTDLCLAPTHEEVFTEIASYEIRSYRDLPQTWYQIQTKFRDEPRPRSGVLRGRQFIMKDAYSFDRDKPGLDKSYELEREAYLRIFKRCGLEVFTVKASSGIMGGSESEEFMILSPIGEDKLARCSSCGYIANLEVAYASAFKPETQSKPRKKVSTPTQRTIADVSEFLDIKPNRLMKSLVFISAGKPVMVLIRGDHEANEEKLAGVFGADIRPATPEEVLELTGAQVGFVGPVGLKGVNIVADLALQGQVDLTTGANEDGYHLTGLEAGRDFKVDQYLDLRTVCEGDTCPFCSSPINILAAIELGHIFKLGTKYTEALGATFLDADGQPKPIIMGSYGIGVERIVASVIEQYADDSGLVWPASIAPYHIHILPINTSDKRSMELAEEFYNTLTGQGLETIIDDRNERAGVKFKDADLLGMPVRITIGEKSLSEGKVELRIRKSGETTKIDISEVVDKSASIVREMLSEYR